MEYFRQVQWAYKFSDANVQISYRRAVKGTPLMPRDLFLMAASGRMHRVIDDQGRSWWSVAAIQNVSDSLDVVAQLQGQMLVRRADRWGPLPVGTDGQVLTFNITSGMPEWADAGSGGHPSWGTIVGSLADQADLEAALTAAAASGEWGHITGTLADQLDLSAALATASILADWGHITGVITDQADLAAELGTIATNVAAAAVTAVWGHIGGSLTDQADLATAIAAAAVNTWGTMVGTLSDQADLQAALNAKWALTGNNVAVGNQDVTGYIAGTEVRTSLIKGGAALELRGDDVKIEKGDGSATWAEFNSAGGNINAGGTTVINITNTEVVYNIDIKRGAHRLWSRFISDPTGFSILQYDAPVTRPRQATLTWVNQGGSGSGGTIATDVDNGILIENVAAFAATNLRYMRWPTPLPATWTATVRVIDEVQISNGSILGALILRNSTSGRAIIWGSFNNNTQIVLQNYSSLTAFSGNILGPVTTCASAFPWRKITFDGTTLTFLASQDGQIYYSIASVAAATFINALGGAIDHIGIGLMSNGTKAASVFQHFTVA